MIRSSRGILAAIATLAALGLGAAQAAPVTWGSPTDISGDGDVSTNGTLVNAWNFGSATSTTVGGVLFQGVLIPESPPLPAPQIQVVSHSFGPHTLSTFNERFERTLTNFATGSAVGPFTALSSTYRALLGSAAGTNFGDRDTDLLLGGLTIGQTYEFQAWVNDSSIEGCCSFGIDLDGVSLNPNTATDANSGDVVAGGVGQFVIGTFVADAATQELIYTRGEIGGGLNGFQLRAIAPLSVPEPGTFALVGLAALGLVAARRRPARS